MARTELAVIERQLKQLEPQFGQLLMPLDINPGRIITTVMIQCELNKDLLNCDLPSIIQGATTFAVLGIEADGVTGQGYLIPFKKKGQPRATPVIGYKGYNTIAARAEMTITGGIVREGDKFEYQFGTGAFLRHIPSDQPTDGRRPRFAWSQAESHGRPPSIVVMPWADVLAVRERSKAYTGGGDTPWRDEKIGLWAMAEKTAKRRLSRSLPLLVEHRTHRPQFNYAATMDETIEERGKRAWVHPDRGVVIDQEVGPVAGAEPSAGPTLEQITGREFVIKGARGEERFATIEEWRTKMIGIIGTIPSREALERFRELNMGVMEDYRVIGHDAAVNTVWQAFEQRLGR